MPHIKSKFPLPPPIPDANAHHAMFGNPGEPLPVDFTVHIDMASSQRRSFHELRQRTLEGATALVAPTSAGGLGLNIDVGHMVGVYSHNCMDYVPLVNALVYAAVPFSLLSALATVRELTHELEVSKPTHLFVQPELLLTALDAARQVGLPENCIYILEGEAVGRKSFQDLLNKVRQLGTPIVPVMPVTKDTLAYVVFTSGISTSKKAVMISHGNIWAAVCCQDIVLTQESKVLPERVPQNPRQTWLLSLPFYTACGLHLACFQQFYHPHTYVIVQKWNSDVVLNAIAKYGINAMSLTPSAIQQLAESPLWAKTDLSTVNRIYSYTTYLPPHLSRFIRAFKNVDIIEDYGMSEHSHSVTHKPAPGLYGLRSPPGCTGMLLPGVEARVLRLDGSEADFDEPGELWLKGPQVALGYYNGRKASKETFINGWLKTGDVFKIAEDELLFFVDRLKDTFTVSGLLVSPTEIEKALLADPGKLIAEVCVAGVAGDRAALAKVPRAWIVLSEEGKRRGSEETIWILDAWVQRVLGCHKWLRGGYEVVDSIPKTPTGKVLRRALQDQHRQSLPGRARL